MKLLRVTNKINNRQILQNKHKHRNIDNTDMFVRVKCIKSYI